MLDSDLPSRTAAELIRRLEKLRAAELRSLLAEDLAIPGRVRVIASGASLLFTELAQDRFFTGSFLVKSGHRWDALRFARRATELAPWDAGAAATLAEVDALLDAWEGAIEMRKRAVLLSADANLRAHLDEVLVRCTPASN